MPTSTLIDDSIHPEWVQPASSQENPSSQQSWPFKWLHGVRWLISRLFGSLSLLFLLAAAASLPILQLVSFGYLLEISGRLARGGKLSGAIIGLEKASRVGGLILGTWLLLLPIRLVSLLWYEAYLIDPGSQQTAVWRIVQITLIGVIMAQILAAWLCGGKLRYFFWQAIAPFSFIIWLIRKMASLRSLRPLLHACLDWVSPHLVRNLCDTRPLTDWFVPAILLKKIVRRTLYTDARDGLWKFVASLRLWFYFQLGLKGFLGTFLWLLIPTALLMAGTATDTLASLGSALFGFALAVPLFVFLPFLQVHFSRHGTWQSFLQPLHVLAIFWRAPMAHGLALLLTLALAVPLFLLKIEEIPTELLWTLSLVFVAFTLPSRIAVGLAYRRGDRPGKQGRWWLGLPVIGLSLPLSFTFVFIMFFTRYITWNGMWSLMENHVFLLPAPFWL